MIAFILIAIVCDVVRSQSPIESYKPPEMLMEALDDATQGAETLRSFVEAIPTTDTVPNLQDLKDIIERLPSAASSIANLFLLTQQLASEGKTADLELVDKKYQKIDINIDQLQFSAEGLALSDAQLAVFIPYQLPYDNLKKMYEKYKQLITKISDSTTRSNFISACNADETVPGGYLENIHTIITATDRPHGSNFMEVVEIGSNYDISVVRRIFRIIVTDVARATMMQHACLGMKQKSIVEQTAAVTNARNKISQIVDKFEPVIKKLLDTATNPDSAFIDSVRAAVSAKVDIWSTFSMDNITTGLKDYLNSKYSWLMWNVFVYELGANPQRHINSRLNENTKSDSAGLVYQTSDFRNFVMVFKGNMIVGVAWAYMGTFEDDRVSLQTYKMQDLQMYNPLGCMAPGRRPLPREQGAFLYRWQHLKLVFLATRRGKFFADFANNAAEFQLCSAYVAVLAA